jgi:hypothetical protein
MVGVSMGVNVVVGVSDGRGVSVTVEVGASEGAGVHEARIAVVRTKNRNHEAGIL